MQHPRDDLGMNYIFPLVRHRADRAQGISSCENMQPSDSEVLRPAAPNAKAAGIECSAPAAASGTPENPNQSKSTGLQRDRSRNRQIRFLMGYERIL